MLTCVSSPVLLSSQHAHVTRLLSPSEGPATKRVLQVMKWGLVPSWYKGEPGKFPNLLNNCRHEGMLEKPSFRTAVQKKQRCVVLADGWVHTILCIFFVIADSPYELFNYNNYDSLASYIFIVNNYNMKPWQSRLLVGYLKSCTQFLIL